MKIRKYLSHRAWGILFLLASWSGAGTGSLAAQTASFFAPADSFDGRRFWISTATGTAIYGTVMVGLTQAWYAETPRSSFQTFNDGGEWRDMDKWGHGITAYQESRWLTQGARWTGLSPSRARWIGTGTAFLLQGSIEMLDAYSEKWGFSWWDMAANTAGCLLFAGQDWAWQEQRIQIKVSFARPRYPLYPVSSLDGERVETLKDRAEALFGRSDLQRFLKDYNAQTYWLTFHPSLLGDYAPSWLPPWLTLATGVRGDHLFAGFGYSWTDPDDGRRFELDPGQFPRRSRYFLSLDVDLTRIPVRNPFWRSVLHGLNFIKMPFPALEWRSDGMLRGHLLYF